MGLTGNNIVAVGTTDIEPWRQPDLDAPGRVSLPPGAREKSGTGDSAEPADAGVDDTLPQAATHTLACNRTCMRVAARRSLA